MIQRPTGVDMPVYAALSTMRQQPTQDEIANGVIPLDTLPANWWNWLWNTITKAQNDLQYNDEVIFTEINNVLAAGGITPNPTADAQAVHDQLIRAINVIKNAVATTTTLGVVKSSDTGTDGSVRVNTGGTMSVNGFGDLSTLHTVDKSTITSAINEVHDEVDALNTNLTQEIQTEAAEIRGEIGTLSSLTTSAKGSTVAAINELQTEVDTNKTSIGTLSSLTTSAKGSAVAAINELQTEVDTNKTSIGTLSSLTTSAKGSAVAAINELQSEVNTNKTSIGTLSSLTTSAKGSIVSAINELQSEVNNVAGGAQNIAVCVPLQGNMNVEVTSTNVASISGWLNLVVIPEGLNNAVSRITVDSDGGLVTITRIEELGGSRCICNVSIDFIVTAFLTSSKFKGFDLHTRMATDQASANLLKTIAENSIGHGLSGAATFVRQRHTVKDIVLIDEVGAAYIQPFIASDLRSSSVNVYTMNYTAVSAIYYKISTSYQFSLT